jgi:Transposase
VARNLPIDGHSFRRVEVLTGAPRRRRWSAAEKAAIVAESQAPGAQTSEIALRYGLPRNQLYDWQPEFGTVAVGTAIAEAGAQGPDFVPVVADAGSGAAAIDPGRGSRRLCSPAFLTWLTGLLATAELVKLLGLLARAGNSVQPIQRGTAAKLGVAAREVPR